MTMTLTEPRFVCDETGNKVAVVLPIDLYEELVELLEQHDDLKAIEEAMQDAERIPWEQVKTELGVSGEFRTGGPARPQANPRSAQGPHRCNDRFLAR